MEENYHHIQSYKFEVELLEEESVQEIQTRLERIIKLRLLEISERVFDEFCSPDIIWRIPRIEIDLGEVDFVRFEADLEYALRQALKGYFTKLADRVEGGDDQGEMEIMVPVQSKQELLTRFLKTGTLPWWAPTSFYNRSFSLIENLREIHEEDPQVIQAVFSEAAKQTTMLRRLSAQLTDKEMTEVTTFGSSSLRTEIGEILQELKNAHRTLSAGKFFTDKMDLSKSPIPIGQIKYFLWATVIELRAEGGSLDSSSILNRMLSYWSNQSDISPGVFLQQLQEGLRKSSALPTPRIDAFLSKRPVRTIENTEQKKKEDGHADIVSEEVVQALLSSREEAEDAQLEAPDFDKNRPIQPKEADEIFISLLSGEVSLKDLQKRWLVKSERIMWLVELADEDLWSIAQVMAPVNVLELRGLLTEIPILARHPYFTRIATASIRSVFIEVVLTRLLQIKPGGHIERDQIIGSFLAKLSDKLTIPLKSVVQAVSGLTEAPNFKNIAENLRQHYDGTIVIEGEVHPESDEGDQGAREDEVRSEIDDDGQRASEDRSGMDDDGKGVKGNEARPGIDDDVHGASEEEVHPFTDDDYKVKKEEISPGIDDERILINFFILGVYPVEYIPSIEEYTETFVKRFPLRFEKIIRALTPVQMIRMMVRIEQEFNAPAKDIILERIQGIRGVIIPDSTIRKIGPARLSDVSRRADDTQYLIQRWLVDESVSKKMTFDFNELVGEFIRKFPVESREFLRSLPADDLSQLIRRIEYKLKKVVTDLTDTVDEEGFSPPDKELVKLIASEEEALSLEEPIYIRNAGLVILYPFLSRYFKLLGLLAEDRKGFKNEETVQRAVHLLHFLVFGEQQGKEYEMTLNKLICGMPFGVPLEKNISLTDEEQETSEGLLKGAIQNWEIIKSSSISNFRGSFLIREGRLRHGEHSWSLNVEQRAYDMLLDKIPWSFKIVKLPWMKKPIHVEWR